MHAHKAMERATIFSASAICPLLPYLYIRWRKTLSFTTHTQIALLLNRLHCGRKGWWHIFFLCSSLMHFTMMGSNSSSLETLKTLHTESQPWCCIQYVYSISSLKTLKISTLHLTLSAPLGFTMTLWKKKKEKKKNIVLFKVQPCFKNTTLWVNVIYRKWNEIRPLDIKWWF